MLDQITPVILTYNEEANIARVLDKLSWAERVVIVDSYSTDDTLAIIKNYPNVRLYQREFDNHSSQWNYAIRETNIAIEWVLALDADYVLTDDLISEIKRLEPDEGTLGYSASFTYCVFGQPLRGTLYPPVTVLYRRVAGIYIQDGHTQRIDIESGIKELTGKVLHDDRKPLSSWLRAQERYMVLEADVIRNTAFNKLGLHDRIRKMIFFAPPLAFIYCLIIKRGILDGWPGLYYATQRSVAEMILSLKLIERMIGGDGE